LLLNHREINGIIYPIISNTRNRLEELFIRLILLNRLIDNSGNSLKPNFVYSKKDKIIFFAQKLKEKHH